MGRIVGLVVLLICGGVAVKYEPLYQFYAHAGVLPLPPWGWTELPESTPKTEIVHVDKYRQAGTEALSFMEKYQQKVELPSLSAAVAIDGQLVWSGAVGFADIQRKQPATPKTIYRIGSTSKALTSIALARLVEREELQLDVPLSTYLKPLPNPVWAEITLRQLASHSSGIPHYGQNTEIWGLLETARLTQHYDSMALAIQLFDESDLLFSPGAQFEYSSLGTVLLGFVMSQVTQTPYRQLMRQEVFDVVGMSSTVESPTNLGTSPDFAIPYVKRTHHFRIWRPVDLSHRLPGGGWASTPSDLARFGAKVLDGELLSPDVRNEFWTPQPLADGEVNHQNYALGWRWYEPEVGSSVPYAFAHHGGVSRGGQCFLLVIPEKQMVVAISTNTKTEVFTDFGHAYRGVVQAFSDDSSIE